MQTAKQPQRNRIATPRRQAGRGRVPFCALLVAITVFHMMPTSSFGTTYYVNDTSTVNDVWCSVRGDGGNDGLTSSSPKDSIQGVLDAYVLGPRDVMYVDTGVYGLSSNVVVGLQHGGMSTGYVTICGSPHSAGTVLDRGSTNSGSWGIMLDRCSYVKLQDLRIRNAERGIYGFTANTVLVDRCVVTGCVTGAQFQEGTGQWVRNSILANNGVGLTVSGGNARNIWVVNNTFYGNGVAGFRYNPGFNGSSTIPIYLRNNIFHVALGYGVRIDTNWRISLSDYNDYWMTGSGLAGYWYGGTSYATLADWRYGTGLDTNSISADPLFANAGAGDFHLTVFSPCCDRGLNEPWMNDTKDCEGNSRIVNGNVDMGAFETRLQMIVKTLLQGPYSTNTHMMLAQLGTNILAVSPYALDTRQLSTNSEGVVDWVLLGLISSNGRTVMASSVLLNPQGQTMGSTRNGGTVVEVSPGQSYYVVIWHRNHLAAMTAEPIAFTNILTSYDFTTNWTSYYGGSNACVELEPGVWGMIAGDADGDGKITPADRAIVSNQVGRTGYLPGDLNLDGVVTKDE